MKYDAFEFDMPWRPNYEARASVSWAVAALASAGVHLTTTMPPEPFYWMTGICAAMATTRLPAAFSHAKLKRNLEGRELYFMDVKQVQDTVRKHKETLYLGRGFEWENRHIQRAFELLKRDVSTLERRSVMDKNAQTLKMGHKWIHGLEPHEKNLYQPLKHIEGHTLILGTTGAGKTRCFDLFISQCINAGEAVITVDPKGDFDLRNKQKVLCDSLGQSDRFAYFHPAFPEDSVRIDLLANFSEPSELATRIAALIPSETGMDPFVSFGWMALNTLINALLLIDNQPSLVKLKHYLDSGTDGLLYQAVMAYGKQINEKHDVDSQSLFENVAMHDTRKKAQLSKKYYQTVLYRKRPSTALDSLIAMNDHDRQHLGKMIATLMPILAMLTSGNLEKLLSPDHTDLNDTRPILDSSSIINQGKVLYVGLNSLTDKMVGSAIGSLLLSDATAVAGNRYNYGVNLRPVNLFVDEAAEVINDPCIALLNKGRGALFRLFIASQTIADFAARLGNEDKATQVLANLNNVIALRLVEPKTAEFVTAGLPKTRVKYVMRTQGQNSHGDEPILHGGNQGERLMEEEIDLVPYQLLSMLPDLEYFGRVSGGRVIKGRIPILKAA